MDDAIGDAILGGVTEDPVLVLLLDVTVTSIREERPLFQSPLDEPVLYKHFKKYVQNALDGLAKLEE